MFAAATCLSTLCVWIVDLSSTESAIANGDTRTIRLVHAHTGETIEATYRVDGHYDPAVLEKLNWFVRDWRRNEATKMDPRLFDAVWEAYRGAGATEPIVVLCGFRSPETNAMLRARSRAVAEHSQHILGKAMDTTMPGMSMEKVREVAMRLQLGGVGYYAGSNFVHIDVGGVRHWPRMSYDQLARLFPDGKTVHIPSNGQPLARYEEARAEIQARGGAIEVPPSSQGPNFFAWLFNLGRGEDEREEVAADMPTRTAPPVRVANRSQPTEVADKPERAVVASLAQTDKAPLPLPPARQIELASLSADIPLPPSRPADTFTTQTAAAPKKDAIGNLISSASSAVPLRAASLPDLITHGSTTSDVAPAAVLAYAAGAQLEGLRSAARNRNAGNAMRGLVATQAPAPMIPARLDRSNFLTMTGPVAAAFLPTQTVLGPTVAGLRQVAQNQLRIQAGSLSHVALSARQVRFALAATDLPTDHFIDATRKSSYALALRTESGHVVVGSLALKNGE